MKKSISTKRALLSSGLALLLCISMLIGSTFAWFTDSVSSANNIIKSGNLDVELYYQVEGQTDWTKVTETTNIFKENALWEPGHTEVVKLKVVNEGTLALKYQLGVNIASEIGSVNVNGDPFKLSDHIKYGVVEGAQPYNRDEAVAAAEAVGATKLNVPNTKSASLVAGAESVVTMVVYMPTTVGNDANYAKGADVPTINLGINLFATQLMHEEDSFDETYDKMATIDDVNELNVALAADTDLIVLGADINLTDSVVIPAGKTVAIDLAGYTMSYESANPGEDMITNKGNLTIKDSVGTGKITYKNNDTTATNVTVSTISCEPGSVLAVQSGTVENASVNGAAAGRYAYAIDLVTNGTLGDVTATISGGNVTSVNYMAIRQFVNGEACKNTLNVTGGIITGGTRGINIQQKNNAAYTTITGGRVVGRDYSLCFLTTSENISVTGGEFSGEVWYSGEAGIITGGTFDDVSAMKYLADNANVTIKPAKDVALTETLTVPATATVVLDLNGKTLSYTNTTAAASCAINNKGTLTLSNGTVTYAGIGDPNFGYGTNTINNTGKLVINGATIINTTATGSSVAIDCAAGADLIVNSGEIKSVKNAIRLCPFGNAAIKCTINGGIITGARAIQIQLPSNTPTSAPVIELTVIDGTLNGTTGMSIYSYSAGQSFANVKIALEGGTYNNDVAFGGGSAADQETVAVTGGTFNGELGRYVEDDGTNNGWLDIVKP